MILFSLFSSKNWYVEYVKFLIKKEDEKFQRKKEKTLFKMYSYYKDKHNYDVSILDNFLLDYKKNNN